MSLFIIQALVECDTFDQAVTVASERFSYDETYDDPNTGEEFDYRLTQLATTRWGAKQP